MEWPCFPEGDETNITCSWYTIKLLMVLHKSRFSIILDSTNIQAALYWERYHLRLSLIAEKSLHVDYSLIIKIIIIIIIIIIDYNNQIFKQDNLSLAVPVEVVACTAGCTVLLVLAFPTVKMRELGVLLVQYTYN